ncbi:UNVERIFIED_CONTAM: hypothetical protein GTU68_041081 [Idotea baltica]|nr:hypothetical protein [Idotea baltica]
MRLMGKAAFVQIQDRSGRGQLYVRKDEVGEELFEEFKTYDLGDIITSSGRLFETKTGERTLRSATIRSLVKCLHPLPEKFHGLSDVEIRYRQRYLDLIVNPEVQNTFKSRAKIISYIRSFFEAREYIEVETPVMAPEASGAAARPFRTHHNALGVDLSLRIALELPLKKLVVGGMERVYELSRVFRNEGISTEHNPEFTMLEFYQAYATYQDLMDLTEDLLSGLCQDLHASTELNFKEQEISFAKPFARLSMKDSIHEIGGVSKDFDLESLESVQQAAASVGLEDFGDITDYGKALYELFDQYVESKIVNPTFITAHPKSVSPLARPSLDDPRFTDRFELMVAGMELANAFSELNDAEDQAERFAEQLKLKEAGDEEAMGLDWDFITALEYGLPPTAGQGIGIDRLVMLMTDSASIRDVILFPTLKPQAKATADEQS